MGIQACFGCLATQLYWLLALPKAIVGGAIGGAVHAVARVLVAIVYLPNHIWFTYRCFTQTKAVGPNLRTLILLLLPVPLLCYPIIAAIRCFFIGAVCGGAPLLAGGERANGRQHAFIREHTREDWLTLPWSGAALAVKSVTKSIQEFVRLSAKQYPYELEKIRYHPGPPFDISIPRLLASLVVAVMGGVLGLIGACLEEPKMPFLLLRGWYEVAMSFMQQSHQRKILAFIPYCLSMALVPVGVALCMVLIPIGCLSSAVFMAAKSGYQSPTISSMAMYGLVGAWNVVHALEGFLNQMLPRFVDCICYDIFSIKLIISDGTDPDMTKVVDVNIIVFTGSDGADIVLLSMVPTRDYNNRKVVHVSYPLKRSSQKLAVKEVVLSHTVDIPTVTDKVESNSVAKGDVEIGMHTVETV